MARFQRKTAVIECNGATISSEVVSSRNSDFPHGLGLVLNARVANKKVAETPPSDVVFQVAGREFPANTAVRSLLHN